MLVLFFYWVLNYGWFFVFFFWGVRVLVLFIFVMSFVCFTVWYYRVRGCMSDFWFCNLGYEVRKELIVWFFVILGFLLVFIGFFDFSGLARFVVGWLVIIRSFVVVFCDLGIGWVIWYRFCRVRRVVVLGCNWIRGIVLCEIIFSVVKLGFCDGEGEVFFNFVRNGGMEVLDCKEGIRCRLVL